MENRDLQQALEWIFESEGGYVNHPRDPGGATNMGITQRTYDAWRRGKSLPTQSVKKITRNEAALIYVQDFAAPIRFEELPIGVAYCVFDFAVNSNPTNATKALQRVINAHFKTNPPDDPRHPRKLILDGRLGSLTLAAVRDIDPMLLVDKLTAERRRFVRTLTHYPTFKNGWERRITLVRDRAARQIRSAPAENLPGFPTEGKAYGTQSVSASVLESSRSKAGAIGGAAALGSFASEVIEVVRPAQELAEYARIAGWVGLAIVIAACLYIVWHRTRTVT